MEYNRHYSCGFMLVDTPRAILAFKLMPRGRPQYKGRQFGLTETPVETLGIHSQIGRPL